MTLLSDLKRHHVGIDDQLSRPHPDNGEMLYQARWLLSNPFGHVAGVLATNGDNAVSNPRRRNAPIFRSYAKDEWYAYSDTTSNIEGPYEFEQLLTILALEGFTHVY